MYITISFIHCYVGLSANAMAAVINYATVQNVAEKMDMMTGKGKKNEIV